MFFSTAHTSAISALYVLSCTLAVTPLLLVLSATAFVFYGTLPGLCVFGAGLVSVAGFILHCLISAQKQLGSSLPTVSTGIEKGRLADFNGCIVRSEKSIYRDI